MMSWTTSAGPVQTRDGAAPPDEAGSVVAIDVGGTSIKAARLRLDGTLADQRSVATPVHRGQAAVLAAIADVAGSLVVAGTTTVGLCVPGILDPIAGRVRYAPNLGLRDAPLVAVVRDRVGLPVVLEQDVRAACLAEVRLGLGHDVKDLLVVVLGTGIAAGMVVGGTVALGATSAAGEMGHQPVYIDGEPCACGQRGCLEVYASAAGMVRRYQAAGGSIELSAADIARRAPTDPRAARVWAEGTRALGQALIGITLLLDPALVVFAGGLSGAGAQLLDPVREVLCGGLAWREPPKLSISPLGSRAGLYGAALRAFDGGGHVDAAGELRRRRA